MGLPLCQALGQVLGTHLSSASQSLQSFQRERYGHFRPDSSSLRVCAAHCRPFSISGPDPLNSQAGRQLKMPLHVSICLQRAPLPRLRTTAGKTDLERTEKFGCTSWVWCTLVFARMVAFLLFLIPLSTCSHPPPCSPSPPQGKPDGPEWLSLSQRQRETVARRRNEGLSDPEHCGGGRGGGLLIRLIGNLRAQVKASFPHPPDPVCTLIQPTARFPQSPLCTLPPSLLTVNNTAKDLHREEE